MTDRCKVLRRWTCASSLAILFALAARHPGALAATANSSFTVTGTVTANCSISTAGPTIPYDPVVANTSANAVSPGTVIEGRDMIIQVFRARLSDAGPNGIQGDSDDKLFETQGFFVP